MAWAGIIEEFRKFLPVRDDTPVVTLLEGNTPLVPAAKLSKLLGGGRSVYLKYEGLNPTGSFKDRGMTVALSLAVAEGAHTVLCASTGNTSAAAAAYAARAGIHCAVLLPKGKIAKGKLAQALMYGASVVAIRGNFDVALELIRVLGKRPGYAVVNSINPTRLQGQKTASFEIINALGDAPHVHVLPVGNAGNITAYWMGYKEAKEHGMSNRLPKMLGFQAAKAAPIVLNRIVPKPETVATAIRIGNPASWEGARTALMESGGVCDMVTDEEILRAQRWLASEEGVFVEPASAAGVAGLLKIASEPSELERRIPCDSAVVVTVTGHGLKDPDTAIRQGGKFITCGAKENDVLRALEKIARKY